MIAGAVVEVDGFYCSSILNKVYVHQFIISSSVFATTSSLRAVGLHDPNTELSTVPFSSTWLDDSPLTPSPSRKMHSTRRPSLIASYTIDTQEPMIFLGRPSSSVSATPGCSTSPRLNGTPSVYRTNS